MNATNDSKLAVPMWLERMEQQLGQGLAGRKVVLGLSGGLDSVVLLDVLAKLRPQLGFELEAVHIHHGLQAQADEWARHCADLGVQYGIAVSVRHVQVRPAGLGVEAAARQARYQEFAACGADVVALAHHRDDQVETFMLAALRGGGVRALAAMPQWRALNGQTQLWRPLLDVSRADLAAYAADYGLVYVEDPSNTDVSLLRNWLRHEGLPLWRGRVPHLDQHILGSIALLQDEKSLLDEVVEEDAARLGQAGCWDLAHWRGLSAARRRQLLRYFAQIEGLGVPTQAAVRDFEQTLSAKPAMGGSWQLPLGVAHVYRDRLWACKADWLRECAWLEQDAGMRGRLNKILTQGSFTLRRHSFGLREEVLAKEGAVRTVCADDVLDLTVGRKSVRKILQECAVPPFARRYWPVVVDAQNRCVAIANIWVSVHDGVAGGVLPVFEPFNRFILEPK